MRTAWISFAACLLHGGCILEDNPAFVETESGTTGGSGGSGTLGTSMGPGTDPTVGSADSTHGTTDGTDSTGDDTGGTEGPGCDDPTLCTTYHVGPVEGSCAHEVGGVPTDACDWVGPYALRIAAATLEFDGVGGLIVMHDNNGVTASYVGSIDVIGDTTIRSADDASPSTVRVYSEGSPGVLRLRGDSVHLEGFTVACRSGGEWALSVRQDLDTEGTETGGHVIEGLVMVGTRPENVGANGIVPFFQSLGPDTVVRNNHIWGYFEDTLDLRFASRSVLSHNTVLYYQATGSPLLDASQVDDLEISNNVFASLTRPADAFVGADDTTTGLVVVGNVVEGVNNVLGGLEVTDPDVTVLDNLLDLVAAESPRNPRILTDSALLANPMGVAEGTSLDGIDLATASERLPGAYQTRSPLTERRSVITVGESSCGGSSCDVTQTFDNELQRAVWSAWPGAVVEIYPSVNRYAGPAVVSWPVDLRGMGAQPDDVVIERNLEDQILRDDGVWYGKDVVIDLTRGMSAPTLVEMLTVEAGSEDVGIYHEGTSGGGLPGRHEIRRVILRDDGTVTGDDPADIALYLGDEVVAHDVLIHGGYDTCVRLGPRAYESADTPPSTAYVHHLTCRLTETLVDPPAVFEVASVTGAVFADVAVELFTPGVLFRAQRRTSGEDVDPLVALDIPADFVADSFATLGVTALFDGFTGVDGVYSITAVTEVPAMDPFFVSVSDSHLDPAALAIDSGVDPSLLDPGLSLGVSVDGVDRAMVALPDRGAYEQGQ